MVQSRDGTRRYREHPRIMLNSIGCSPILVRRGSAGDHMIPWQAYFLPCWISGLDRRPLTAENMGSNPIQGVQAF